MLLKVNVFKLVCHMSALASASSVESGRTCGGDIGGPTCSGSSPEMDSGSHVTVVHSTPSGCAGIMLLADQVHETLFLAFWPVTH